jgi:tetratricopeptide (TPR) repeat protein
MANRFPPDHSANSINLDWVELVLYLSEVQYLDAEKIKGWATRFAQVRVVGQGERPPGLPIQAKWHSLTSGHSRAWAWNSMLEKAQTGWMLFLEDDERVDYNRFPREKDVSNDRWVPSVISRTVDNRLRYYYQIRLVPTSQGEVFEGKNLPDCTHHVTDRKIALSSEPICIQRSSNPVEYLDVADEMSVHKFLPKLYLVQGERFYNSGKYVHAAAQYRKVLKSKKLLPFDRLAAVNGLASCMAEQFKWPEALSLAKKSIDAEPVQKLPYLIRYQIYQLNKQWENAFEELHQYHENKDQHSRAGFDKAIGEEETLLSLADLALKKGSRAQASKFFERLLEVRNGDATPSFLKRLLILSIELSDYIRSVSLFKRIFNKHLTDKLSKELNDELNDYMSMFMQRGWYNYTSEVYAKLHHAEPKNADYKRRLIVALSKTNRIEQARNVMSGQK